jgi:hypothetical protein
MDSNSTSPTFNIMRDFFLEIFYKINLFNRNLFYYTYYRLMGEGN